MADCEFCGRETEERDLIGLDEYEICTSCSRIAVGAPRKLSDAMRARYHEYVESMSQECREACL